MITVSYKMTWSVFTFFRWHKILLFNFETNCLVPNSRGTIFRICLVSKLNDANRVKKRVLGVRKLIYSKKVCLEFGTKRFYANHWVKESPPGVRTLHHWVSNCRWRIFLTRLTSLRHKLHSHFFCRSALHYLPRLSFLILWHKWDPPHLWGVFRYYGLHRGFSTRMFSFLMKVHQIQDIAYYKGSARHQSFRKSNPWVLSQKFCEVYLIQ